MKRQVLVLCLLALLGARTATGQTPTFELGVRYWAPSETVKMAFKNGSPLFGNPTSTINWDHMKSRSVEMTLRTNHRRSGLFVKGLVGFGKVGDGIMTDQDFYVGQVKYSDTSSRIAGGKTLYASVDAGIAHHTKKGSHIGGFVGVQIWRGKITAVGVHDNDDRRIDLVGVAALIYEPQWNSLRIGTEGKVALHKWSVEGEAVWVPLAGLTNYDSHLLRIVSLGPTPNIIDRSVRGRGIQLEGFINYESTPKNAIGIGVRYWRLSTTYGDVEWVRPRIFSRLTGFSEKHLGVLVQFKHKF